MGTEIIVTLVGLFCTTVSSIVTFILTRKKYNSEVEAQHIENIKEALETYKYTMNATVEAQNKKIEDLQKENDNLKQQIHLLQKQLMEVFTSGTILSKEAAPAHID